MRSNRDEAKEEAAVRVDDRQLSLWECRAERNLTAEEVREIEANVLGFFGILLDWDAASGSEQPEPLRPSDEAT